jgi:hypothetical protein
MAGNKITILLNDDEMNALSDLSNKSMRTIEQQARWLLRNILITNKSIAQTIYQEEVDDYDDDWVGPN